MDNMDIATTESPNRSNKIVLFCFLAVVVVNLGLGIFYLYQKAGLKYFIRAGMFINNIQSETDKKQAWKDFIGKSENGYSGIYAGNWRNRVWVWGRSGLRSFATDQYSVYTFFDGCTESILNSVDQGGVSVSISREVFFNVNVDDWKKKVSVGDLVVITIARDGVLGNLREIYTYNFWPFLHKDLQTLCAK